MICVAISGLVIQHQAIHTDVMVHCDDWHFNSEEIPHLCSDISFCIFI